MGVRTEYGKEYSDAFYLMLLQGVNYLLPLVLIPFLMKRLGADGYGAVGFATAFVQYIVLITDFGFNLSATKSLARAAQTGTEEDTGRIFSATLKAKLLLLAASTLLFAALSLTIPRFRQFGPAIACMYPMAIGMTFTFTWLFQGLGRIRVLSLINTVSKLAVLPLIFIFVKGPQHLLPACLIQGGVYMVAAAASILYLLKWKPFRWVSTGFAEIRFALKDSAPLFLSTVSTSVYTSLFTVLLALFVTPAALGCYSAAERLMRAGCFVLYTPLSQAFFPRIAALGASDRTEAFRMKKRVALTAGIIMGCVGLSIVVLSGPAERFAGEGYEGLAAILRILAPAPLAIGLGGVFGQMGLIALGDGKAGVRFRNVYFMAAPLSLALLLCLSPVWGIRGAAAALLVTEAFVCLMMFFHDRRMRLC